MSKVKIQTQKGLKTVVQFKRVELKMIFVNAEVEIENATIRNSDEERVENSNSVQKSGAEDDIVNVEVEIENAAIRNSDEE